LRCAPETSGDFRRRKRSRAAAKPTENSRVLDTLEGRVLLAQISTTETLAIPIRSAALATDRYAGRVGSLQRRLHGKNLKGLEIAESTESASE
jgi:hypothetical protein